MEIGRIYFSIHQYARISSNPDRETLDNQAFTAPIKRSMITTGFISMTEIFALPEVHLLTMIVILSDLSAVLTASAVASALHSMTLSQPQASATFASEVFFPA